MEIKARHTHALTTLRVLAAAVFVAAAILVQAHPAAAATVKKGVPAYQASVGARMPELLEVDTKHTLTVTQKFTNTGSKVWRATGNNLVALNAVMQTSAGLDINRSSKLRDPSWGTIVRPVKIAKDVKPGESVMLTFTILGPKTSGEYREKFSLVAKGVDFIPGSTIELLVRVGNPKTAAYRTDTALTAAATYTVPAGKAKTFELTVTNTGSATWKRRGAGEVVLAVAEPSTRTSKFWHANWYGKHVLGRLTTSEVKPGKKGTFRFALQAPSEYGEYTEKFQVLVPGLTRAVDGLLNLTVVAPNPNPGPVVTNSLGAEPTVRVGVVTTSDGWVELRPSTTASLTDAGNKVIATVAAGTVVRLTYAKTGYTFTLNGITTPAPGPYRLTGSANTLLTISSWNSQYNTYRGIFEFRFTPATGKTWLINELPMEQYVSGLAETGNTGPTEFLRTMAVAARTYALFHNLRKTKHADEFYDINATTDQLYKGYGYETKVPNLVAAVAATRGIVMTHPTPVTEKNTVGAIVAAYSSCTDGRTRSFSEVWGAEQSYFPYLLSVPDAIGTCTTPPYPASYLTGGSGNHMVGMSAFGALKYAKDQGKTYDWILTTYYTGITLKQVYP
ncbi:MAG: SpoIID/LytB domain-containing protein [Patescibacteria group bacterium]